MLKDDRHFEIGPQVLRSGTSIGANIVEAQRAESTKYFIHKLSISLKEADETRYWLEIIDLKITKVKSSLKSENEELIKILVTVIKSSKLKLKNQNS